MKNIRDWDRLRACGSYGRQNQYVKNARKSLGKRHFEIKKKMDDYVYTSEIRKRT
jgi:hypothetical protein